MNGGNIFGSVARRAAPMVVGGLLWCTLVTPAQSALTWPIMQAGTGGVTVVAAVQKRSKGKKVKQVAEPERTPSGETVANRERRLTRECRGRSNAGACAGYGN